MGIFRLLKIMSPIKILLACLGTWVHSDVCADIAYAYDEDGVIKQKFVQAKYFWVGEISKSGWWISSRELSL